MKEGQSNLWTRQILAPMKIQTGFHTEVPIGPKSQPLGGNPLTIFFAPLAALPGIALLTFTEPFRFHDVQFTH